MHMAKRNLIDITDLSTAEEIRDLIATAEDILA
jgi:hypothetical protein